MNSRLTTVWEYKGGCWIGINEASNPFIPKIVRDDGLVIFFNCDAWTYRIKSTQHE